MHQRAKQLLAAVAGPVRARRTALGPCTRLFAGAAYVAVLLVAGCDKQEITDPRTVAPAPAGPEFTATDPFNNQGVCLAADAYLSGAVSGVNSVDDLADPTKNCTANDISIASADISAYSLDGITFTPFNTGDQVSCNKGDPIFIQVAAHVKETATSQRTDIGIWIANDGGNARTGECNHYNLLATDPPTAPSESPVDQCGDMNDANEVVVPLGIIDAVCQTSGAQDATLLHIGSCLGWTVPGGDQVCPQTLNPRTNDPVSGPDGFRWGTVPSEKSKCNCGGFDVPIIVQESAKLEIVKKCTPSTDTGTFDLLIDGGTVDATHPDAFKKDNATCDGVASPANTTGEQTVGAGTNTAPGEDHSITENDFTIADYTSSYQCTLDGSASVISQCGAAGTDACSGSSTGPTNINVQPDQDIVCTYTNVKKAGITIIKNTVPDGAQDFAFTTSGTGLSNFSLDDDADNTLSNTKSFTGLAPGTRTVTESAASGYALTDIQCTGATSSTVTIGAAGGFDAGDNSVSIVLAAGENVSCTFTNTQNGSLTIVKDAVPDDAQDFAYTASGTGVSNFNLDDDADNTLSNTKAFTGLLAGSRTITEGAVSGWTLTNIACTGATSSTVTIGASGGFDAGDNSVTVDLATGENVSCRFTNTKQGSLTIVKDDKNPETDAQDFSYTTSGPGMSNFSLDDDADNTLSNTKAFTGLLPNATARTAAEGTNSEWTLTNIVCTGATSSTVTIGAAGGFNAGDNSVSVSLAAGENVTCTFTNERKARLIVQKVVVGGGTQSFDFTRNPGSVTFSLQNGGENNSGFTLAPNTYRVCELNLAVDWAAVATINGNSATLINPDFPQDLGNRCVDVALTYGDSKTVVWTNTPPPAGGDARTIGYWKNWSSCAQSSGRQYTKALSRGDWSRTLDGNLPQTIGDLVIAGAPGANQPAAGCSVAVRILSKQDVKNGKNMASDAAYGLAAQLLAAKLNVTAGADVCAAAAAAITGGQQLLDDINFLGTGGYLKNASANRTAALGFAATLDSYNNNTLCP